MSSVRLPEHVLDDDHESPQPLQLILAVRKRYMCYARFGSGVWLIHSPSSASGSSGQNVYTTSLL